MQKLIDTLEIIGIVIESILVLSPVALIIWGIWFVSNH